MTDFESLSADLDSYPITGFLPGGTYINLPLISHITDNLYVGGCQPTDLGDFFSHVFSFFVWGRYDVADGVVLNEYEMYDGNGVDPRPIAEAVPEIVEALEAGGNVLVHCQAGINRSNLVAAHVLREWKNLTSAEAIGLLRERRGDVVLANQTFEQYLLGLDSAG